MAKCSTCKLLIKEPFLDFSNRVNGEEESYDYGLVIDERITGNSGLFTAIHCFLITTQPKPVFKSLSGIGACSECNIN